MEKMAKAFTAAGYETRAPTLRHHEEGPRRGRDLTALATTSMRDYADDLRNEIEASGEKPILVGHSMGGLLAQMLAAHGLARAIILLAPSAPWGLISTQWEQYASAFGLYMTAGQFWERSLDPAYEIAAEHALDRLPAEERKAVFARFVPESGRAVFEILQWWLDVTRATDVPAVNVTCPVFCAGGGHDRVNPQETVKRVAARYRADTTYKEYPEMSHWLIGEPGWETVTADALAWLNEREL